MTELKKATLDEIKEELIERYRKTGDNRISIWAGDTKEENSVEIDLHPEKWDKKDGDTITKKPQPKPDPGWDNPAKPEPI